MSHAATNWAFQQRNLSPIAFRLLANLADCHNPAAGCFPSQAYLTERCEISRSSVNRHLDELEQKGLIRRETRVHEVTKRQLPTRYFLAFEADFTPLDVASRVSTADTGSAGTRVSGWDTENSEQPEGLAGDNPASRVSETGVPVSHSSDTLTSKEPINPLPPDEGVSFERLVDLWPDAEPGSLGSARRAFERLTVIQRNRAVALVGVTRSIGYRLKRAVPTLAGYLRHRLFEEVDGDPPPIEGSHFRITTGRPEWRRWLEATRAIHGAKIAARVEQQGFLLTKSRWPETHDHREDA